jgi:BatD DUF11 like domain
MKHFYQFLLLSFFSCGYLLLPAQAKFTTILNETEIGKNDLVQVQYIVENAESVEKITPPAFKGFSVASGPSQLQGMTIINGALSKYQGLSYLLLPNTTGKLSIQGATAVINGKPMKSNTVTVVVTNSGNNKTPNTGPSFNLPIPDLPEAQEEVSEDYILRAGESIAGKIQNNLFAKVEVSKTSCYEGEPIVATYKLYSRLKSESKVTKRPTLNGFSVYDMIPPGSGDTRVEKINGRLYNVHIIRKVQLYPLQPGTFELDAVELDNTVHFLRVASKANSMQQLLDEYSKGAEGKPEEQSVTLSSKPVTITVKALPTANKPVAFDGAVGNFTIRAFISPDIVVANEPANLQLEIKGEGNLPLINAPEINWPAGVEADEPQTNEMSDKSVCPITGSKQFDYPFRVKQAGSIAIPSLSWSYFDPSTGTYKTIKTDSISLPVTKGAMPHIKTKVVEKSKLDTKPFNWLSLTWAVPVLLLTLLFFIHRQKNHQKQKKVRAMAAIQKGGEETISVADLFAGARMALYDHNNQLFYQEVGNTVWNNISKKLSITSSQLNKPFVIQLLQQKNMSVTGIQQFEQVVQDCEMALYTPYHSEINMKNTLQNASSFIEQLQALA